MTVADILATPVVWIVGFALVRKWCRGLSRPIASWAYFGYCGHLISGIAQILLTRNYFGGGDMFLYALEGGWIAEAVARSPERFLTEVIALALQQEADLPVLIIGAGSSTGSMAAFSGLLLLGTGGSLYASIAIVATAAYLGKLALFRTLREHMPERERGLVVACLLVPSAMFWSAGLLKEAVATGPLCMLVALLFQARGWWSWRTAVAGACAIPVALTKPYILMALLVAAAAMFYVRRASRRGTVTIRPVYLAVGALMAVGGLVFLGNLFPEYAVENLAENLAHQQAVGQRVTGGSTFAVADEEQRGIVGQLTFAPVAIITALFRPFAFEFHNAPSFVAAVEMTLITLLAARALVKRSWRELLRQVLNSPILAFCLVFTLAFGLGVGLGTTNMGTLSRYRMPLMPFWATLLMVWNADLFERKPVRRSGAAHAVATAGAGPRRIRAREEVKADT